MLLGLDAICPGCFLTEMKKLADVVTEFRKLLKCFSGKAGLSS